MAPYLTALAVKDLALVSALELELEPGLTVLTGETGAGKSMLVDALGAATGGRVSSGMVREGAERARVDAAFSSLDLERRASLRERGLEADDDTLVLTREISTGRAPSRINHRSVQLSLLAEIGEELVAVHGQGEQNRLTRTGVQRDLLDGFGGHDALRAAVAERAAARRALARERESLGGDPRERARRLELLAHEADEITGARIEPGEGERLARDLAIARSAERLRTSAFAAHDLLAGERSAARDRLALAARELEGAAGTDERLADLAARVAAQVDETDDLAAALRRYAETVDADPAALEALEARDDQLSQLRRKYGPTLVDVLAYGERAALELAQLRTADERLARLDADEATAKAAHESACRALHEARREAADRLASAVERELADLGLPRCRFAVSLEAQEPDASGADRVRYQIAPNPGEPAQPIEAIASGGELSRIMLAIEVTLAEHSKTAVLVFDEVDSGVGGRLGETLGRKLWSLGRAHQVLCVSHLPQVAAYADHHARVTKRVARGRTHVEAARLDEDAVVLELAAMLGAGGSSRSLTAGARELREGALAWRKAQRLERAGRGRSPEQR